MSGIIQTLRGSFSAAVPSGNIGFVKVYNGVLTLAAIQSLHATYKARFGY